MCVCVFVYLRRASFHIQLGGDDALLAEDGGHFVHLAAFHSLHQPVVILVPVCVLDKGHGEIQSAWWTRLLLVNYKGECGYEGQRTF